MRRRVTAVAAFYESLATLDESQETLEVFKTLMLRVATDPERGPTLPGMSVRVMKTRGYGPFPPLRIFYWIDDDTVYLLEVDVYGQTYET